MSLSHFVRGFLKRIQNSVSTNSLWRKGDSFIVGVSGGPDSMCLLDVLAILSKKYDFTIHIAHVNYDLRGNESKKDEMLVKERAHFYNVSCSILRPKKKTYGNLEENLRDIRYHFFEKLRKENMANAIVVAHNEDDQAETFLMRLFRGSGSSGLSSMSMKNGFVIRPFLKTSRKDILKYIEDRQLPFRLDKSNTDTHLMRNRFRHKLIPLIEKEYQPKIKEILAHTAELLSADATVLQELAHTSLVVKEEHNSVSFSCKKLLAESEVLASYKLRLLLLPFFQSKNPSQGLVHELMKALKSTKNKSQMMTFRGLKLVRKGDTVTLLKLAE